MVIAVCCGRTVFSMMNFQLQGTSKSSRPAHTMSRAAPSGPNHSDICSPDDGLERFRPGPGCSKPCQAVLNCSKLTEVAKELCQRRRLVAAGDEDETAEDLAGPV